MWFGLDKKPNSFKVYNIKKGHPERGGPFAFSQVPSGRLYVPCFTRDGIVRVLGGVSASSTIPSKEALPHGINGQHSLDP